MGSEPTGKKPTGRPKGGKNKPRGLVPPKKMPGRVKKPNLFDNALSSDPEFMKVHLGDTKRTYHANLEFLEKIRDGVVVDSQYDPKSGDIVERPVSMDVRVRAIAQINAMTLHKVFADKKESGREKDGGKGIDHEAALKQVEAARMKDKAMEKVRSEAIAAGKLTRIPAVFVGES
jgi:hypothetical protein